jgi:hypothetical protein
VPNIVPIHRGVASSARTQTERRFKERYAVDLSVRFRPLSGSFFQGAGHVVNVSSGGVLVVSHHTASRQEFPVGALLEMRIAWPALLDGTVPLQLIAVGRVVRYRTSGFAATFERYQFRTASALPHTLSVV